MPKNTALPATTDERKARAKAARALLADQPIGDDLVSPEARENAAPFYFELRACIFRLKQAREAAGLTLVQIAERTGLAPETLSRLETGAVTNPTWKTIADYAVAVGCRLRLTAEPDPA